MNENTNGLIRQYLKKDSAFKNIADYAKRHSLFAISHEWIYQFILKDKQAGGELYKHLRHKNKKYRKRYGSPKKQCSIRNRRFIDDRPHEVNEKMRIGDWEIDTIIGKNREKAIVTIVERVSKITVLKRVEHKTAEMVANATVSGLKSYADYVFSITSDNGAEFASHEKISMELGADFYFAHPYSSWERGLNENTNGLVRQYIKNGSDFKWITDEVLGEIENKLNNRPRKSLDFMTPNEVFTIINVSYV